MLIGSQIKLGVLSKKLHSVLFSQVILLQTYWRRWLAKNYVETLREMKLKTLEWERKVRKIRRIMLNMPYLRFKASGMLAMNATRYCYSFYQELGNWHCNATTSHFKMATRRKSSDQNKSLGLNYIHRIIKLELLM